MEDCRLNPIAQELYFLITKFLEAGPCKKAVEALKQELAVHKIVPKRLDWEGNEHEQTFEELEAKFSHIGALHLLKICQRIGPILDKEVKPSVSGVLSLLGAGRQSLLRTTKDVDKTHFKLVEFAARRHQASIYSPISCHHHNIVQVLYGRELSGPFSKRHAVDTRVYSKIHLLNRALGHLSAVYCLLFDHTGKYVITGADDLLVKVWSVIDSRLLYTFRGASSEITDIAINLENTLLAAGSLDRNIRVWCLQSTYPVAVLTGHTGMITGVNFCPNTINGIHYLVSTSTDGSVAFWSFNKLPETNSVVFQIKPIQYHEKLRPGQAQMVCAAFSPGGMFLAAGSGDHHVRVYSMKGEVPHRIMETEKHSDRVDSIQWANRSLRFISGSKDGTAIIWCYRARQWTSLQLFMTEKLPNKKEKEEENKVKLRVTMVCWNVDDSCVITAVNNYSLKVWEPLTGKLLQVFTCHKDEIYVLESNPLNSRVLLSAGHDGVIIFWDILTGEQLTTYQNYIEGQGNGAVFDAKWSPDGTMVAATDSHGHILLFGLSMYNDKIKLIPKELFFHTDYRPLVRDAQHNVLDEQTEIPPHLMPPPFLVDIDGNPYPPEHQRLVPGRYHCTVDQLIPNIVLSAGGQPEVVQAVGDARSNINQMIIALAERSSHQDPQGNSSRYNSSPRSRIGMRRTGDVEGVRQSSGNWQRDDMNWTERVLIPPQSHGALVAATNMIESLGCLEVQEYERESQRDVEVEYVQTVSKPDGKQRKRNLHGYRTRAAREYEQQETQEADTESSPSSDNNTSDTTAHSEDMSSCSSDSSSSEYSDWIADHGVNLEPPQRSRRKRQPKPPPPPPPPAAPKSQTRRAPPQIASTPQNPALPQSPAPSQNHAAPPNPVEIPEPYRPSEWLSEVIPKKFPYYPQMGDEVMFFKQGYDLYLRTVMEKNVYQVANSQSNPYGKIHLKEPELVKVIGIKYEIRPPRLCCLRLAVMKSNGRLTGDRFTIRYHDIPDVIDFLVLKQTYDIAMARSWKIGDRFRSMIDDGWWWGSIEGRRPDSNSAFLCHRIRWDNGEVEDMSPWDMEPVDRAREPEIGGSVPVLPEEIASILYHPRPDEWPGGERDVACQTILSGLEDVMSLAIAEPFIAPVDINIYPSYTFIVEYPIDLSTIKARFENRFYRRVTTAQFDIRYLATNAEKFNEPHSAIVKQARIVTDLCLRIIKEESLQDVPSMYRQLLESYHSSNSEDEDDLLKPSTSTWQHAAASRSLRALRRASRHGHQPSDWRKDCWDLIDVLWNCQDSEPFREPVDVLEHPDYEKVIDTPMDLCTIREELRGGNYDGPLEFCKDVRTIFANSRNYNTNKRSKIYVMTVRLSAMAEEHMKRIIQNWKSSNRKQNRQNVNGPKGKYKKRVRTVVSYEEKNTDSDTDQLSSENASSKGMSPEKSMYLNSFNSVNSTNTNGTLDKITIRVSGKTGRARTCRVKSYFENQTDSDSDNVSEDTNITRISQNRTLSRNSEHNSDCDNNIGDAIDNDNAYGGGDDNGYGGDDYEDSDDDDIEDSGTDNNVNWSGSGVSENSQSTSLDGVKEDKVQPSEVITIDSSTGSSEKGSLPFKLWSLNKKGTVKILKPLRREPDPPEAEEDKDSKFEVCRSGESNGGKSESSLSDSSSTSSTTTSPTTNTRKRRKTSSSESSDCYRPGGSSGSRPSRPRRTVKRRNYAAAPSDSDNQEAGGSGGGGRPQRTQRRNYGETAGDTTDDTSDDTPKFSISSRGRIRKLTARARAFLKE